MIHPNSMWNTAWWTGSNSCAILGVKKKRSAKCQVPRSSVAPIAHVYSIPWPALQEVLLEDLYEHTSASIAMKSFVVLLSSVVCGSSMQWIKDVISTSVIQCLKSNLFDIEKVVQLMISDECSCKKRRTLCPAFASCKWFLSQPCDGTCGGASQWLDFKKQNNPATKSSTNLLETSQPWYVSFQEGMKKWWKIILTFLWFSCFSRMAEFSPHACGGGGGSRVAAAAAEATIRATGSWSQDIHPGKPRWQW